MNSNPYKLLVSNDDNNIDDNIDKSSESSSKKWKIHSTKRSKHKIHKQYRNSDINNKRKKILCRSVLLNTQCKWGSNCSYAHNLEEQKKESLRKIAYDIITSESNLSYINLETNNNLFNTLLTLTNVCSLCEAHQCQGGYNCSSGAISKQHQICKDDLLNGKCDNPLCTKKHLTKRGLKIIKSYNQTNTNKNNNKIFGILLNDEYFKNNETFVDKKTEDDNLNTKNINNNNNNKDEKYNENDINTTIYMEKNNKNDEEYIENNEEETEYTCGSLGEINNNDIGTSIFDVDFTTLDDIDKIENK